MIFENLPSSPLPASTVTHLEQLRKMTPSAPNMATSGIVLYSAAWCGYCKQAKAYLAGKGIPYQEFDVDTKSGMEAYAQAGGRRGVPLLLADGQRVQGFSRAAYDALFANRK
jgi:glutaredoxin